MQNCTLKLLQVKMEFLTSVFSLREIQHDESLSIEKHDIAIFAKAYAVEQLKKNGYNLLADRVTDFKLQGTIVHQLINKITEKFASERREQLEEICFELQITSETLQETFQTITSEIFRSDIKWGRIVSFIAFSGAVTLYCAEHDMQSKVNDVLQWAEELVVERLSNWISSNGGWDGLVDHFVGQETLVTSVGPNVFVGVGLAALAIAGGLLAYKKKLLLR